MSKTERELSRGEAIKAGGLILGYLYVCAAVPGAAICLANDYEKKQEWLKTEQLKILEREGLLGSHKLEEIKVDRYTEVSGEYNANGIFPFYSASGEIDTENLYIATLTWKTNSEYPLMVNTSLPFVNFQNIPSRNEMEKQKMVTFDFNIENMIEDGLLDTKNLSKYTHQEYIKSVQLQMPKDEYLKLIR